MDHGMIIKKEDYNHNEWPTKCQQNYKITTKGVTKTGWLITRCEDDAHHRRAVS